MRRAAPPLWLTRSGRFATVTRAQAVAILAALALLVAASLTALGAPIDTGGTDGPGGMGDLALYEAIIDGVRAGGHYYQLAADTMRAGSYPLRPFVTMRLPTHAVVQAALPLAASLALLWLLAVGVAAAWWVRLADALARPLPRVAAMILLAGGMIAFVQVDLIAFHEIWAAQLVALSMALRRPGRWLDAAALALVAMLVRETAALYVLVMGGLALLEGQRREALGWLATFLVFLAALAAHAHGVASVTGPLDPASPGWSGMLGFGFFVRAIVTSDVLRVLPLALAAPLVALALFGWATWRDPLGLRAAATFTGYAAAIALFARADTFYWALMPTPVFLVGLAFVPDGLRDLARGLLDRPRVRVHRITQ